MYNKEQEELNATCIMMARTQEVNTNSKTDPSYDTDDLFEVSSGDVEQDETSYDQNRALIESFNKSMQLDVEQYNTNNREAKEANALLTKVLKHNPKLYHDVSIYDPFVQAYVYDFEETLQLAGMFLSQNKYAMKLLERAHMLNCNPAQTIVDTESKLGPEGEPISDPTLCRSLAGGLQYLTFTHPDLSYVVQQIRLYMHGPREPQLAALKRILRYVQGTLEFGLQLYASFRYSLMAYSDADRVGCPATCRSTFGYCVFFGNNLLSWSTKRQHTLLCSSTEAENRGIANVVDETTRLRNLLQELQTLLMTIFLCIVICSVVYLSANPVQHQLTKHIEIDIHYVRDMVVTGHKSLHCKSDPREVHDPKSKPHLGAILTRKPARSGCSRSIANLKDVINGGSKRHEKPVNCSPRSIGSNEFVNPITHEVILSDSSNGGNGDVTLHSVKNHQQTSTPRRTLSLNSAKALDRNGTANGGGVTGKNVITQKPKETESYGSNSGGGAVTCHKCGKQFGKWENLEAHHLSKHAVTELMEGDSSRKIVEIICRSSLVKAESNSGRIEKVYMLSKCLTEDAAFKFARENNIHLVSIITTTVTGPFLTSTVPLSIRVLLSPVTGDSQLLLVLSAVNSRMGSIALVHTEDICNAHIYLMEHDQAEGRYICCTNSCTMSELAHHLAKVYPSPNSQRLVEEEMVSVPTEISSKKLKDLGFKFKYGLHEVIHQTVDYCIDRGFLPPNKTVTK
nr:ribonuclease H-like domain-containing protein [Tanacetum cinerariifolium]